MYISTKKYFWLFIYLCTRVSKFGWWNNFHHGIYGSNNWKKKAPAEFIQKCLGLWPIKVMCYPNKPCEGKKTKNKKQRIYSEKQSLRNSYIGDVNGKWAKDTLLSSLWERLAAFWTPHITGYLWNQSEAIATPKELLMNVPKG